MRTLPADVARCNLSQCPLARMCLRHLTPPTDSPGQVWIQPEAIPCDSYWPLPGLEPERLNDAEEQLARGETISFDELTEGT